MWKKDNIGESFEKQVSAAIASRRTRIEAAERMNLGTDVCDDYENTIENLEELRPDSIVSGMCHIQGDDGKREVTGVIRHSNGVFISGDSISLDVEDIDHPVSVLLEDIVEIHNRKKAKEE